MSDYSFLQSIEGGWKQLKKWTLQKVTSAPEDSVEGGVWYNETSKRIEVDIGSENKEVAYVGESAEGSVGVIDITSPNVTYNNNGTVTIDSCNVRLFSNPDYEGIAKEYNVPSKTLTMTDGGDEIVIAHYNSGSPEYRLVNRVDDNNYGIGDTAYIYRVWFEFGEFHSQPGDSLGLGLANKVANRISNDNFYSRVGGTGLELSESAGHIIKITGAKVWAGAVKNLVGPFNSSIDKFSIVYKDSSNVWQKQTATSYPNNLYNPDGQGLVALPNNKFTVIYIYRSIGDDKEAFAVLDHEYYNNLDVAVESSTKRLDVPNVTRSHSMLVGRIVFENGSTSGKVQSVWIDPFTAGGIAEHNSLLDKDGGDTINNYYGHVKQIHNNILDNFGKASGAIVSDSNNFIPIEQIPVGLLGGLTPKGAWNPSTNTPTLSNPPLATTRGWFYIASTSGTALGTDWASGDWCISDGTVWQKIDNTDKVSSVFGRTGSVVAASGDYNLDQINDGTTYKRITSTEKNNYNTAYTHSQSTGNSHSIVASQIPSTATGGISANNIQSAIAELDSEKLSSGTALTDYVQLRSVLSTGQTGKLTASAANSSSVQGWTKLYSWTPTAYTKRHMMLHAVSGGRGTLVGIVYMSFMQEATATTISAASISVENVNGEVSNFSLIYNSTSSMIELWYNDIFSSNQQTVFSPIKISGPLPTAYYGVSQATLPTYSIKYDSINLHVDYLNGLTSNVQTQLNGKEPTIPAGTTAQYFRGDKSWQSLLISVQATLLTGISFATNAAILASDNIIQALGKLQAQITSIVGDYVSKSDTAKQTIVSDLNISNAHIGAWSGNTNYSRVGHKDFNTAGGFGFMQTNDGRVLVETPSSLAISMRQNGVNKLVITSTGNTQIVAPPTSDDSDLAVTSAWVKDVAAPLSHASDNTTYGVATSTNYGHVQIIDTVTDGSTKAITSNAVFDGLAGKSSTSHNHTLDALSNITITSNSNGEILKWNGTAWVNNTLSEAGIAAASHTHGSISNVVRKFSYKYSTIDGVNLWTQIASFTISSNITYHFGIEFSMTGDDSPWSTSPINMYVTIRDGSIDVCGICTSNKSSQIEVYYGISNGVAKVYLKNWSNWVTAYVGAILYDSHDVVNFASSSTTAPSAGYTNVYTPTTQIVCGSGLSAGASVVVRQFNTSNSYSSNVIYLEY